MLTLDEIRNVEFGRGRGYRAEEVDDFIDACVETVEQLIREKEELTQKMKVLADKVIEYRNDEDSIRAALLNAQRAGDAVLREAEAKAAEIVREAEQQAANIRSVALSKVDSEKHELERIQREVEAFKSRLMALYKEHLEIISKLPSEKAEPAKEEAAPAEETAAEEPAPVVEAEPAVVEEAPAAEESTEESDDDMIVVPAAEEVVVPTEGEDDMKPVSRFSDLKFGNDYDIRTDKDDLPKRSPFKKRK